MSIIKTSRGAKSSNTLDGDSGFGTKFDTRRRHLTPKTTIRCENSLSHMNWTGKISRRRLDDAIRPSGILIRDFQEQEDEVRGACNANARRLNARERRARVCGETSSFGAHCSAAANASRRWEAPHQLWPRVFYLHPQINEKSCCYSFRAVCDRCTQHVIRERADYFGKWILLFCSHLVAGKSKLANEGQPDWVISDRDEFISKGLPLQKIN